MKGDAEWQAVTEKVEGRDPAYSSMAVTCFIATIPEEPGSSMAQQVRPHKIVGARSGLDHAPGARRAPCTTHARRSAAHGAWSCRAQGMQRGSRAVLIGSCSCHRSAPAGGR
jgi:hypothetical protein